MEPHDRGVGRVTSGGVDRPSTGRVTGGAVPHGADLAALVIADDLTGANATGASFARRGFRTLTVRGGDELPGLADGIDVDVLVVDTDSRHVEAGDAADRVRATLEDAPAAALVVKRTDTTLRGNVGAETEAMIAWLRDRHDGVRGLMVPAFPAAGRTTVGGLQLVDGVPLSQTEVARDPRGPVDRSRVADLLRQQSDLDVTEVTLDVVIAGHEDLRLALDNDVDVTIVDAVDRGNLRAIAEAAAQLAKTTRWCSIDPGPFGPELAGALGLVRATAATAPLLIASGSATSATAAQLAAAERVIGARLLTLDVLEIDVDGAVEQLVALLHDSPADAIVGLRTVDADTGTVSLSAREAQAVPALIGRIVAAVLDRMPVGGLYTTGGDVTLGVLDALGSQGIAIEEEVLPLAVAGRLAGGPHRGLPIVTKGGLVGDALAAVACLDDLRARATRAGPHAGTDHPDRRAARRPR